MAGWKTKVFGDTRFNFYGGIFGGIIVIGSSTFEMVKALRASTNMAVQNHLLLGIYILLLGQFAVSMQNYSARVAKVIEEEDEKK